MLYLHVVRGLFPCQCSAFVLSLLTFSLRWLPKLLTTGEELICVPDSCWDSPECHHSYSCLGHIYRCQPGFLSSLTPERQSVNKSLVTQPPEGILHCFSCHCPCHTAVMAGLIPVTTSLTHTLRLAAKQYCPYQCSLQYSSKNTFEFVIPVCSYFSIWYVYVIIVVC